MRRKLTEWFLKVTFPRREHRRLWSAQCVSHKEGKDFKCYFLLLFFFTGASCTYSTRFSYETQHWKYFCVQEAHRESKLDTYTSDATRHVGNMWPLTVTLPVPFLHQQQEQLDPSSSTVSLFPSLCFSDSGSIFIHTSAQLSSQVHFSLFASIRGYIFTFIIYYSAGNIVSILQHFPPRFGQMGPVAAVVAAMAVTGRTWNYVHLFIRPAQKKKKVLTCQVYLCKWKFQLKVQLKHLASCNLDHHHFHREKLHQWIKETSAIASM